MEIAADQLDFVLENGNELKTGDTVGKAKITIFPAPSVRSRNKGKRQELDGRLTGHDSGHGRQVSRDVR